MATEITSKSELASLAENLNSRSLELKDITNDLASKISSVENFDDIDVVSAANVLVKNLNAVSQDLDTVSTNINNYTLQIINYDTDDFSSNNVESYLASLGGSSVTLPGGLGSVHSYMGWQCITAKSSLQYKLREAAGMNFDENGFAKIGDRYVVATTTTYGNVGDYIDVVQADGSVIKCIIGDIKNQNDAGCNKWGHNNGQCVVEFVVDKGSWYGTAKSVAGYHPEWGQNISQVVNKGNYFELSNKYDTGAVSSLTPVAVASVNNQSNVPSTNSNVAVATTAGAATYIASSSGGSKVGNSVAQNNVPIESSMTSSNLKYAPSQNDSVTPAIDQVTGKHPGDDITSTMSVSTAGDIDISKYHNNLAAGFEVTTDNQTFTVSDSDYNLLCAIVAAESDKSYDDALAVITTILNRCEASNWVASYGTNPISQATAKNQFVVYQHGSYKQYMGNCPETVMTAVKDALAGVRNHHYLSFRSNGSTSYGGSMITSSGNRYK